MRKASTLTFGALPNSQRYNPGDLVVTKGRCLPYLTLKTVLTIHNAGGGSKTLSDAEINTLLSSCQISLRHGKAKPRTAFDNLRMDWLRKLSREAIGQDWRGVADATGGLTQPIAAAGNITATLYVEVPLGIQFKDESILDVRGVGPNQAKTIFLEVKLSDATAPANITITAATLTAELPEKSCREERWENIPEFRTYTETKDIWSSEDGLVLLFAETSTTNAASSLSSLRVSVAGETLHENVSAAEIGQDFSMDPGLPTVADLTTDWNVHHVYNTRQKTREYLPGRVVVEDVAGAMRGTNKVVVSYYRPNLTEAELRAEIASMAKDAGAAYRAVSLFNAIGVSMEPALKHFFGLALVPPGEADAKDLSGVQSISGSPAVAVVAPITRAKLKNTQAVSGNGSPAAMRLIADTAASIPGGNTNPAVFRRTGGVSNSMALAAVAQAIARP